MDVMHYYSFNPKDYMSKTAFLEPMEDLAYRRMLDHCYLTELPLPDDVSEIAMLIRMRSHTESIKVVLHYFFELTPQGYVCDRIARELAAYHSKSEKAKASADARWEKHRNKSKDLPKENPEFKSDANALRDECERNANNKQRTNNQEPVTNINITADESAKNPKPKRITKKQKAINALIEMGVGEKYAQAVIEKRKGSEFTELAIEEIKLQAEAVNLNFVQAIEFAAKQEWGSFRADWYQNRMAKQQQSYHPQNQANPWTEYNKRVGEQFSQNEMVDVTPKKSVLIEEVGHA